MDGVTKKCNKHGANKPVSPSMLLHIYSDVTNETDIHSSEVMVNTYVNI